MYLRVRNRFGQKHRQLEVRIEQIYLLNVRVFWNAIKTAQYHLQQWK